VARSSIDYVHPALDLVNSQHGRGPDLLEDDTWLQGFLARWGYVPAGRPGPRERSRLAGLRTLMRRIVESVAGGSTPTAADLARLDHVLRAVKASRRLDVRGTSFDVRLVPTRRDWSWVLSELASELAALLAGGELERLKVCDNDDCRFAFYDASKNRSRRWCAQTTCGNRHKVQQFRARRRAERYSASR
jgi:predicted RNA-binding Zn ribbon-like protein